LYRVVGPDDKVKAKGNRSTMIEKMKRLIRHEFLQPGDVLGVSRNMGLYEHYAIYIGNGEVIHYAGDDKEISPQNARVCKADLSKFMSNTSVDCFGVGAFKKKDDIKIYSDEETVERAFSRLGEKKYNLVINNCEHFAMWCKTGVSVSYQVKKVERDLERAVEGDIVANGKRVLDYIIESVPKVKEIGIRKYGIVHKREKVEINGIKGFLVWDYIIYNEITFEDMNGNMYSFFSNISDKKTEEEWSRLIQKFGD
jgi:hypothetical protein